MQLQQFVSETLKQIVAGTKDAQKGVNESEGLVNPQFMKPRFEDLVKPVEFDVAVTTTEGSETKGGIGIFVGSVGVGTQGKADASNVSVSRIRFSIPISLPPQMPGIPPTS